ncbi:hypothetical protein VKT23_020165 [Stygiomarasmius scandens]|uniref:HAT C-terminal dimerisation domain-containing protein n=1 Tax=Marasmiellus scandens TaxID=2682957 RepID=A0ABR1INH0_9AGAR
MAFFKSSLTRAAAAKAIAILNKYYSKTDESIMYQVTMIMHPLYRLKYFKDVHWEQDWIDTAKNTACEFFQEHYLFGVKVKSSTTSQESQLHKSSIFAKIDNYGKDDSGEDIFTQYIKEEPCTNDPIQFWTSKLDKPGDKPTPKGALAQMGLDFCSAPAASTDVECLFSHGGLLVTKH